MISAVYRKCVVVDSVSLYRALRADAVVARAQ